MNYINGSVGRRVLLSAIALVMAAPSIADAQSDTVIMRRPIIVKKNPGTVTPPDEVDPILDPASACDENSERFTLDARWVADTTTTGDNAAGNCTNTTTKYHCSIVTVCKVGGTETPVASDAADAICREFLENRGPIFLPNT